MKKINRLSINLSFICTILFNGSIIAQSETLTPQIEQKIKQKVEIAAQKFKIKCKSERGGASDEDVEFHVDTFKIQRIVSFSMDYESTTGGMNKIVAEATEKYDKLLNKYYQKLLAVLEGKDKQVLIDAQRAWLKFRDLEMNLVGTLGASKYSGGGTMQSNISVGEYADLVEKRTIAIYQHYMRSKGF